MKDCESVINEFNDTNLNESSKKSYYNINSNSVSPRLSGIKVDVPKEKVLQKVSDKYSDKDTDHKNEEPSNELLRTENENISKNCEDIVEKYKKGNKDPKEELIISKLLQPNGINYENEEVSN